MEHIDPMIETFNEIEERKKTKKFYIFLTIVIIATLITVVEFFYHLGKETSEGKYDSEKNELANRVDSLEAVACKAEKERDSIHENLIAFLRIKEAFQPPDPIKSSPFKRTDPSTSDPKDEFGLPKNDRYMQSVNFLEEKIKKLNTFIRFLTDQHEDYKKSARALRDELFSTISRLSTIRLKIYTSDEGDKENAEKEFDEIVNGITKRVNEFDKSEDGSLINKATANMDLAESKIDKEREDKIRKELNDKIDQIIFNNAQDIYDNAIQSKDQLKRVISFPFNRKSKCELVHNTRLLFDKVISITDNLFDKKAKELNKKCLDQIEEFVKDYPKCQ